jgi:hypothetical protein
MSAKKSKSDPFNQLAAVYDSLAEDVFDVPLDVDDETTERAVRIARAALDKVPGATPTIEFAIDKTSGTAKFWTEDKVLIRHTDIRAGKTRLPGTSPDTLPGSTEDPNKPSRPTKPIKPS